MTDPAHNVLKKTWRKTALIFFINIISLLSIDLLAGWLLIPPIHNDFRTPHNYFHHGLLPNQKATDKWGASEYLFYTNSLGLRDSSKKSVPLIPQNKRILLIGDSFIEGQGVTFEESVSGRLQKMLTSEKIEVLNASVVSYSPKLYLLKVKYLLENIGLRFDELVVFIDISDIQNEIVYQHFYPQQLSLKKIITFKIDKLLRKRSYVYYAIRGQTSGGMPDFGNGIFDNPFNHFDDTDKEVVNHTYDIDFLAAWTYDPVIFQLYGRKGLNLAQENMTSLVQLCKQHNIKIKLAVYPWPHQIERREIDCIQVAEWKHFCKKMGIPFINFFPVFINDVSPGKIIDDFFIAGDVHWNNNGHELVALELFRRLSASSNHDRQPK